MSAFMEATFSWWTWCTNRRSANGTSFHGYAQLLKLLGTDLGPTTDRKTQHEWVLEIHVLGRHRPITTVYDYFETTKIASDSARRHTRTPIDSMRVSTGVVQSSSISATTATLDGSRNLETSSINSSPTPAFAKSAEMPPAIPAVAPIANPTGPNRTPMRLPSEVPARVPSGPESSPCLIVAVPSAFFATTA